MKTKPIIKRALRPDETKQLREATNTLLKNCDVIYDTTRPINEFTDKEMAEDFEPVARLMDKLIKRYGTK